MIGKKLFMIVRVVDDLDWQKYTSLLPAKTCLLAQLEDKKDLIHMKTLV